MVYYRVALMTNQSPTWKWKSSVLTSLETLFNFLKIYRAIPKDRVRVFLSSTAERMDELLTRENNGLVSNSLTAEQLLNGYKVSSLEVTKLELELCVEGDHDIPYQFSPPATLQQALAWTKLLTKVRNGELEP